MSERDLMSGEVPGGVVESHVSADVRRRVEAMIADIDRRLGAQLDAVLHHPTLQRLERAWRSAWLVVSAVEPGANVVLQIWSCTKDELIDDLEDHPHLDRCALYRAVGDHLLDRRGVPVSAFVADFELGPDRRDLTALRRCAMIAGIVHAPFIAGAAPSLFGVTRFADLEPVGEELECRLRELEPLEELRQLEESRHVALTVPHALLRDRHRCLDGELHYEERIDDASQRLWGNAAFALATRLVDSFQRYGWSPNIIGPRGGGMVAGLAAAPFMDGEGDTIYVSTDRPLTEREEWHISEAGLVPLTCSRKQPAACFYSASSMLRPKYFGETEEGRDAELNHRLSTQLPYVLITNRIADYLKVVHRVHMGVWTERVQIERGLNQWANELVAGRCVLDAADRARRMLRKVRITVEDMENEEGWYRLELKLRPFFKHMGAFFTLETIGKLDKAMHSDVEA
jgi:type VI secretion system protein ImpC